jgi:hypothetical protein
MHIGRCAWAIIWQVELTSFSLTPSLMTAVSALVVLLPAARLQRRAAGRQGLASRRHAPGLRRGGAAWRDSLTNAATGNFW